MNSQRIDNAPMSGVMMNGSRLTKMTGPRNDCNARLTDNASAKPTNNTSGSVIKVKVRVKRNAR